MSIFIACSSQKMEDDLAPADQELNTLPTEDNSGNPEDDNTIDPGKALFSINNENKELYENDALLLTNNSINAVSYQWDFGNGDTSTEAHPDYQYKIHGYYTVKLTVTDADGNTHEASDEILVLCVFGGGDHEQ